MSAYNFQKRFAPDIAAKRKRCTIRARRKNGYVPEIGSTISLYTGMRTRACKLLLRVKVKMVRPVIVRCLDDKNLEAVILEGRVLSQKECIDLARKDGFQGTQDFAAFFFGQHGAEADLHLIQW